MKSIKLLAFSIVICLLSGFSSFGQTLELDSLYPSEYGDEPELFTEISTLDPDKAALMSAILPGLGQVYNKQYWKLPIIFGAGFTIGYYINYNHSYYQSLRNSLIAATDGNDATINRFENLSETTLESRQERFRRDRDFLIIIAAVAYLLNIADAHISAHLEEFAINEELSLSLRPSMQEMPTGANNVGLSLSLKF
ncbi:MAG: DUF5683 domain-containing protein [bacterium]|nr:DUF5683 domain-containing protein [bacterium]